MIENHDIEPDLSFKPQLYSDILIKKYHKHPKERMYNNE